MRIIFLGTGPSEPLNGEGKDSRTNSSIIINAQGKSFLIDVTPAVFNQLKDNNIKKIDFILFTHAHRDAIGGISQIKDWMKLNEITDSIPAYAEKDTWDKIEKKFKDLKHLKQYFVSPHKNYKIQGVEIRPIGVIHSEPVQPGFLTLAYKINDPNGNVIYAEDFESLKKPKEFENADFLILDAAMWFGRKARGHLNVEMAIDLGKKYNVNNLILTQAGRTYPQYNLALRQIKEYWHATKEKSDMNVSLSYDGMVIDTRKMFELFSYIGSKRKDMDRILSHVPTWVKTVYDPMTGSGVIAHALKQKGCTVISNDVSPMCYWWNKAILGNTKMSESDLNDLLNFKPHSGWLTTVCKRTRPTRRGARMWLDGIAEKANSFEGRKKELAMGVVSSLMTRLQGTLGTFKREFEPYTNKTMEEFVRRICKNINDSITTEGSAAVTNDDAETQKIPKVDMIYFDPPYAMKNAANVPYGPHYSLANSVLLQKTWKLPDFPREKIPDYVRKYAKACKILLISTAGDTVVNYKKILDDEKKFVQRYVFPRKTGGAAPKAAKRQADLLWVASNFQKFSELMFEMKEGIYLPDPYAKLIWEGKKSIIVKSKHYRGMQEKMLYIVDKNFAYGILKLDKPHRINMKEFENTKELHCIDNADRVKWWGNKRMLYSYPFTIIEKYKTPKRVSLPEGIQTIVKNVSLVVDMDDTTSGANVATEKKVWAVKPDKKKKDKVEEVKDSKVKTVTLAEVFENFKPMNLFEPLKSSGIPGKSLFYSMKDVLDSLYGEKNG